MTIQELIQKQDNALGEKLINLSKTSDGINSMVAVICDHLGESMAQAYKLGMQVEKDLKNPVILRV